MFSIINIGLLEFLHLEGLLFTAPLTSEGPLENSQGCPKVHLGSLSIQRRQTIENGRFLGLSKCCFQVGLFQTDFFTVGVVLNHLPRVCFCLCMETCTQLLPLMHLSCMSTGGRAQDMAPPLMSCLQRCPGTRQSLAQGPFP